MGFNQLGVLKQYLGADKGGKYMSHLGNLNTALSNSVNDNSKPSNYWGGGHFVTTTELQASGLILEKQDETSLGTSAPIGFLGALRGTIYQCEIPLYLDKRSEASGDYEFIGTYYAIINRDSSSSQVPISFQFNIIDGTSYYTGMLNIVLKISGNTVITATAVDMNSFSKPFAGLKFDIKLTELIQS